MAKLDCKTRGDSSPQGKSRVWFCAHPDDYQEFLVPIADEILAKQNCAVYFDVEPAEPFESEAFFADLSRMNLFILPVTTRLLTTENRAANIELPYALENHIPVLPLMQENGLEELFNQKCGNLHFLNKSKQDTTVINYDKKLERFLSSVLIEDELAEKIRNSFDAYIFLSYRKKDRKYAQELMRLIHQNDFCRDIAIWYDEFLSPGENFNDSIAAALQKSRLFALTVTPNLINEENYVMTVEYPEARKANKTILPAEMVTTDAVELKRKYDCIPACTDAHDGIALSTSLKNALEMIALRENDDDPSHNFFIGLAYLGGVDVEVDHDRAVSLIEGAARDGLPEAIEKLVSMYRSGEGVRRNYEQAVFWQEKLVDRRKGIYEQSPSEDTAWAYFDAMEDLCIHLHELQKLDEAEHVCRQNLLIVQQLAAEYPSWEAERLIASVYSRMGDIAGAHGKLNEALDYYVKGLEIQKELAEQEENVEIMEDIANSYSSMGEMAKQLEDLDCAADYYQKSLAIEEKLLRQADIPDHRYRLARRYIDLGNLAELQNSFVLAREYYMQSLTINEAVAKETGRVDARQNMACCHVYMGNMLEDSDPPSAQRHYALALELFETIDKETKTMESRINLAGIYEDLSNWAKSEREFVQARDYCVRSLNMRQWIAKKTGTAEARFLLCRSYEQLGDIAVAEYMREHAKRHYLKGIELCCGVIEETGLLLYRYQLVDLYFCLSDVEKGLQGWKEAGAQVEKGIEVIEGILRESNTPKARNALAIGYYRRATTCFSYGSEGRMQYLQKARDIWRDLVKEYPENLEYAGWQTGIEKLIH